MKKGKKNVLTIGGGTGSFVLLSGLKKYDINLSAIVSMADDGGSTGVLRDELGVLPPGDVRQCLVALSDSPQIMRDLLNYRFEKGRFKGHNFGNLFLSALEKISGSFSQGLEEAMEILKVKGEVIPVTNNKANLRLKLKNGKILEGENAINHSFFKKDEIKEIYYNSLVKANPRAVKIILSADTIIIGPGNLYCSILPNLIIRGIAKAIRKSKARVIYNCNLTNKKGQTENFKANDYINAIEKYIGQGRINYVVINSKKLPKKLIEKYEKQEGKNILVELDRSNQGKYKVVENAISSQKKIHCSDSDIYSQIRSFIRHDSDRLAKTIMSIIK